MNSTLSCFGLFTELKAAWDDLVFPTACLLLPLGCMQALGKWRLRPVPHSGLRVKNAADHTAGSQYMFTECVNVNFPMIVRMFISQLIFLFFLIWKINNWQQLVLLSTQE